MLRGQLVSQLSLNYRRSFDSLVLIGKQFTDKLVKLQLVRKFIGFARCQVFDSALENILIQPGDMTKLHDECPVRGQWPVVWIGLSLILYHVNFENSAVLFCPGASIS